MEMSLKTPKLFHDVLKGFLLSSGGGTKKRSMGCMWAPGPGLVLTFLTFNAFPEVIAVPSHWRELAEVVVGAPDVDVLVFRAAYDEGVVMTRRRPPPPPHVSFYKAFSMNLLVLLIPSGNILTVHTFWGTSSPPSTWIKLFSFVVKLWKSSSPEAGLDLTAAVDVAFVLHGQRQVPQVVQANAGIIWSHQNLRMASGGAGPEERRSLWSVIINLCFSTTVTWHTSAPWVNVRWAMRNYPIGLIWSKIKKTCLKDHYVQLYLRFMSVEINKRGNEPSTVCVQLHVFYFFFFSFHLTPRSLCGLKLRSRWSLKKLCFEPF